MNIWHRHSIKLKYILFILLLISLINIVISFSHILTGKRVSRFQDAYNASCSIMDSDLDIHGSGALLYNGLVLTSAHVIDTDNNDIISPNEKIVQVQFGIGFITTGVVVYSGLSSYIPRDFALLKLTEQPPIEGFKLTKEWPILGDRLYTIGHPDGKDMQLTDGLFTSRGAGKGICSVPIFPGSSGGPVFNDSMEIVGIISRIGNSPDQTYLRVDDGFGILVTNNYISHQNFYTPATEIVKELYQEILSPRPLRGQLMMLSLLVLVAYVYRERKALLV